MGIARKRGSLCGMRSAFAVPLQLSIAAISLVNPALAYADPVALTDAPPLKGYLVRQWRMRDGLPQNSVNDIVQADDGYLWLATFGGLARFDGTQFDVFGPVQGLDEPRVVSLAVDSDEGLWLGFQDRGVGIFTGGIFRAVGQPELLRSATVFQLTRADGGLWVSSSQGVFQHALAWSHISGEPGAQLRVGVDGGVHVEPKTRSVRGPEGRVWRLKPTRLIVRSARDSNSDHARAMLAWPREFKLARPIFDDVGSLWFGVGRRLVRVGRGDLDAIRRGDMLGTDWAMLELAAPVRKIMQARDGTIWVGTDGAGLYRLTKAAFRSVGPARGESVSGVLPHSGGGYWVTEGCRGLRRVGGYPERQVLAGYCLSAIAEASAGGVWVGGEKGLWHVPEASDAAPRALPDAPRRVRGIVEDDRGRIWVATSRTGLFLSVDRKTRFIRVDERPASALTKGPDGAVWVGRRGEVTRMRFDGLTASPFAVLNGDDGVPPGDVRSLFFDGDDLWVGTYGGGLGWIQPHRKTQVSTVRGLFDDFISAIVDDRRGRLWFNSNRGAFFVDKRDFVALAAGERSDVRSHAVSTYEGNSGHPSFAVRGDDIAFPTISGLVEIDTRRVFKNPFQPTVEIRRAAVDDTELVVNKAVRVPPGHGHFEVEFTAPLLRRPEFSSFEYRLGGFEAQWRRSGSTRQAAYHHLPPGTYAFSVRAINEDHVVGPTTSLSFTLAPFVYQTTWFRGGAAAALVLLGGLFQRRRSRRVRKHNEALQIEVEQRRDAERALGERETHYRRVFESAVNGFIVLDDRNVVIEVNPVAVHILRCPRDRLLGRRISALPDGIELELEPQTDDGTTLGRRADGSSFTARVDRRTYRVSAGVRTLLTVDDIDPLVRAEQERQRLREQLMQSQRIESVGRLAGGVAHDVNNMLTVVSGNIQLARDAVATGDLRDLAAQLEDIEVATHQTGRVTQQLLAFARRHTAGIGVSSIPELVCRVQPMLDRLVRHDVAVRFDVADDVGSVQLDPAHLEQVVVNLIANASDALPGGGVVTLSASGTCPACSTGVVPAVPDRWVRLSVVDEGVGIPPEHLDEVFEPFFTTKPFGEGTGLGLSVVHGIVAQAGGTVEVSSNVGEGTCVTLHLPVAHD